MKDEYLNLAGMYVLSFEELAELIQDYCETMDTTIETFLINRGYESKADI